MSRVIVKGLPSYFTEKNLHDHFGSRGHVTDVKLMKKRNGDSRRFAFIGYKTPEGAEDAVKYYNGSFLNTSRISVEPALSFSDPEVPLLVRNKRKLMEDNLREKEQRLLERELHEDIRKKQRKSGSNIDEEIAQNPDLKEFMEVMKPSHQQRTTASDDLIARAGEEKTVENGSDAEYEDWNSPEKEDAEVPGIENLGKEEEEKMVSLDSFQPATGDVSDQDWLNMRRKRIKDEEAETPGKEPNAKEKLPEQEESESLLVDDELPPQQDSIEKIKATGRLFVRNILYGSTEDDFRELFQQYGSLEEVHVAIDTRSNSSKGFLYIQYKNNDDAVGAYESLDKQIFQGRLLHILPAQQKKVHKLDEFDLKNMPLKKQRELKRKYEANKSQFNWNSLYMNPDAVLESVAKQMGVSKRDLIDPQNSNSAVKQALAEAHVISDVRKFFEDQHIDLTSFGRKERDDKIILVKNFTFGSTSQVIGELFGQYGKLSRVLMPPAGTIAIVEFQDAPSARAAFSKLAYRRLNNSILYLEHGPKGLFTAPPSQDNVEAVYSKSENELVSVEPMANAHDLLEKEAVASEGPDFEGVTVSVFVKNLSFVTSKQQLVRLFQPLPGFISATIKEKPDPKKQGNMLSMGFGFVEFATKEQAESAMGALDGRSLDGHKLQLKISQRQARYGASSDSRAKSNKLIVKNLPFETTRKDILELFQAFGQLKSVRVPKKFDKSARGFGFVEFASASDAGSAMDQLKSVHLLGRKLVIQYAEQDSTDPEAEIAKMTNKVRRQVATREIAATRLAGKTKIALDGEDAFEGL